MPRALDFKHCPARASTGRGIRADGLSGRPCAEAPTDWSHPCPPHRSPARWPRPGSPCRTTRTPSCRSSGPMPRLATTTACCSSAAYPLTALRERFGTPLYVIDEDEVRAHARRALDAFRAAAALHGVQARVYYAGKAFLSSEIVRWVTEEGLAVDVCSGGELAVALAAGADPSRLGFHGNNKSVAELEQAVEAGVGSIVIDSLIEIERLAAIVERRGATQSVLLRVNSGVHAETHDFLATAHEDQKFGFTLQDAAAAVARIRELPGPGVRRPPLPHRLADLRHGGLPGVGGAPRRTARGAARRRRHPRPQPRRGLRHRVHRGRRSHADRAAGRRHRRRRRPGMRRARHPDAESRVRARPRHRRPGGRDALRGRHHQARRARRAAPRAST